MTGVPTRFRWALLAIVALGSAGWWWLSRTPTGTDRIAVRSVGESLPDPVADSADWPWWRGPSGNGVATGPAPVAWSETQNVAWKAPVPGRGHSSPTVVGQHVILATADEDKQVQSVVCYDRQTGKRRWKTDLHQGGFPSRSQMHPKSSHASCTVAADGERLFVAFLNAGSIVATALDMNGKRVWQQTLGPFVPKFGFSTSPVLHKSFVVFSCDHQDGGFLAAVHRHNGSIAWREPRPAVATYSSAVVARVDGRDQLLISGGRRVASYDPETGKPLWSCPGASEATCGTLVWQDDRVFASGGYPQSETLCVMADGTRSVLWRNAQKCYAQSMLAHSGYLYAATDGGVAYCWNNQTGDVMWRSRLGGQCSASPVLAGDNLYVSTERGTTYVFKAQPDAYHLVSRNQLGDESLASPAVCGGRLYLRVASHQQTRREFLYCVGDSETVISEENR